MPRRAAAALLFLLAAAPALADTLLTVRSSIEGLKIAPSQAEPIRIWIGGEKGDRLRRDEGDSSYILRLDRGKLYVVNHADKTYSEIALPVDARKIGAPPEMQVTAQVTATGETKKIGSWNVRKYKVDITNPAGLHLDTTVWASPDVASHQALTRLAASIAALQPGSADWALKLAKIEGFPVLQEAAVTMGTSHFKTREELVGIETKDAPAGTYEPPAGYTAQPYAGLQP
ncbi:MAG TPA: DUF4412 domain-containing protein [Thermoanaerobaculia bacterium]|nr:DUF4412 domain-containing protein [Thermoanaerobaculia bacterium]